LVLERLCCQVCGKRIPPGGVFYVGRTEIISGSDGILPETGESGDTIIKKALSEIEERTDQDLMDEVYQEIKLTLCGQCRLIFRDRILQMIKW
jgi:hypothetical protein